MFHWQKNKSNNFKGVYMPLTALLFLFLQRWEGKEVKEKVRSNQILAGVLKIQQSWENEWMVVELK